MTCGGYYEMIFISLHVSVVNSTSTHNKTETTNNTTREEQDKDEKHQSTKTKPDSKQKKINRKRRKNTINNESKVENITKVQDNSTAYNKTAEERDELWTSSIKANVVYCFQMNSKKVLFRVENSSLGSISANLQCTKGQLWNQH